MPRLFRTATWLAAIVCLAVGLSAASAADRQITLLPGTDLPGFDYSVTKNTTLKACQTACEGDRLCRAFTFNQKTKWCFLKGGVGPATAFAGATSGTISAVPSREDLATTRSQELPFPAQDLLESAKSFANGLATSNPPPAGAAYGNLVAEGDAAAANANAPGAVTSYRQALAILANDPALWLKLAAVELTEADAAAAKQQETDATNFGNDAAIAALNAFLLSETTAERAAGLASLARGLERAQQWPYSIATYRASIALVADADLEARLDKEVAEHGFRVLSSNVDSEAATPRICAVFSDTLPDGKTDISSYVVVDDAPQGAIETEQTQICVTGVEYGHRYHMRLRAGLPAANGEKLRNDVDLNLYVPDRQPFVGFANNAYVLPSGLGGGLPITSVNAKTADVTIYRIGDRSIVSAVRSDQFQGTLDGYSAADVANQSGEKTWSGQVDLAQGAPNANSVTAIPIAQVLPHLEPGVYVITASVAGQPNETYKDLATQWFIVTDLGLTTVSGDDGVHAFVRSLDTAKPVVGAKVRLVAVNNEVLGETTTDTDGRADFAPGLARGDGGRAPQLLVTETAAGDYAFLDVSKPGFDLTDRGVDGRPSPGPLDLFATTERGVYRPGETVFITALLRDAHAKAVANLPLTLQIERPDGVVATREVLKDRGAGGYFTAVPLLAEAMRGSWHAKLYADPKANPLADKTFLVEDFEPDRLAFDLTAPDGPLQIGTPAEIAVAAKYLYGATAPGLSIQADTILRTTSSLKGFPGYSFGRLDDAFETDRESLGVVGTTDDTGAATAAVTLPEAQPTTRPLEAQVILSLIDTNGRAVQHSLTRPVAPAGDLIGIKPRFDVSAGVPQGADAGFDVIAVNPAGAAIAANGLAWTLSRVETSYQWYRDGSTWKWEAITTTRKVANGTVDTVAGGPGTVTGRVESGRYQLEVDSAGDHPASTTFQFDAGYYYPVAGSDTPDKLRVALDKTAYRTGDTAHLKLDPQFAGTALVMVVADRIISMQAVDVPADGSTVDLKVTDDWSPGAYVTAMLYRPSSVAEKRMPARALGLAFADVDPGDMKLNVALDAPTQAAPRAPLSVKVKLGNVAAGQKAYVAVAAVDVGILNLTSFKVPDPDGWYFGQRQLGVEFRDLYGKLIDPTQGLPGTVRSGGDGGGAARLGTPPATSVLVALDSGVVEVGADGTATVSFDMPDFNGSVRLMAMAWTDTAVGHASADVVVHDPVVVNLSPPRFLRFGDTSRLLVEINNVSGPAGAYKVTLDPGEGLRTDAPETEFTLAAGGRKSLDLSLTGAAIGDQKLTLSVTGPDGTAITKHLTLGVRASSGARTTSTLVPIGPGDSVTLDAKYFAGLVPHSSALTLAVGPIARLNVPELLLALDRYPYGCAEQVSSRGMPLLYLNEVAKMLGLGSDDALHQRVKDAVANLLSKQGSNGAFGLWGPSDASDLWLDAYVTEFLLRARKEGYDVPAVPLDRALDNLGNSVSSAADFSNGGEDIAYALYDLARGGRAAIGDLRYYFEARLDAFGSPLAKAQLGAALALYGDRPRAAAAFAAAVAGLKTPDDPKRYRTDYGSQLRDTAGVLALAAEFTPAGVDIAALSRDLAHLRDLKQYTSTQEDAWSLLAAAAVEREAANGSVTIDGQAVTGSVYRHYDQEHFDGATVTVTNNGNQPTEMKVSVTGIPATPPPASSQGFTIERQYYLPDGTAFDPAASPIHQNDRFVVVLTVGATSLGSGNWLVADPLPAGFEIENPDLTAGGDTSSFSSWLTVDTPTHVEARTDQFVAAYRYATETASFSSAYMVRAVSPGRFVMPGATVEDMYRPELRANTGAGNIKVDPPGHEQQ